MVHLLFFCEYLTKTYEIITEFEENYLVRGDVPCDFYYYHISSDKVNRVHRVLDSDNLPKKFTHKG